MRLGAAESFAGLIVTGRKLVEKSAAERCKQIAQQEYLSENQAVEIDEKISAEFGV